MKQPVVPFAMPRTIDPVLARVRDYWESLKRGNANMPFWDDFKPSSLPDLSDRLMLLDVDDNIPVRFRLNLVGSQISDRYGSVITGTFVDELDLKSPFEYLASQCSATVESRAPTFYQQAANAERRPEKPPTYSRILLPMWGNGYIGMLLGAFA